MLHVKKRNINATRSSKTVLMSGGNWKPAVNNLAAEAMVYVKRDEHILFTLQPFPAIVFS